ncbi:putative P450 monooxygenase [Pseudovirgaria hyperparasitica]|uniref:Putative P450 monooxygenase n=1 Tax=Pseudovirgaria hyperparasitica TaxID=470096 RepID=A0A6A6WGD9_9PEZI|nr:putative P450 monooxygenase [Pseudovirgaria hyperparasitica]KAF2761110.1 putative P450 monooxygenase [Pseudovirgaria hyperparasitica]
MPSLFLLAVGSAIAYGIALIFYRLFLSPLAKFPGPKLAAATGWVETYYQLWHGEGGQFMYAYKEWHKTYGPIVRISPWEVHIEDSSYFHVLNSTSQPYKKLPKYANMFNNPQSTFSTIDPKLHRIRRAALNPFFSKMKITERGPNIQDAMDRLTDRLQHDYVGEDKVLSINDMWGCYTSDIIVEYAFEKRENFIETPEFRSAFQHALINLSEPIHTAMQFPWFTDAMKSLPDFLLNYLDPRIAVFNKYKANLLNQVEVANAKFHEGHKKGDNIFRSIFASDLPASERRIERVHQEALGITGAATETTMRTLTIAVYHIFSDPSIKARLLQELKTVMPGTTSGASIPSLETIWRLPYLTAVLTECLRFSYGIFTRIPRISDVPVQYGKWTIPSGAVISMDISDVHHDEQIFPDSFAFKPERWLEDPKAFDGKPLTRYMVAFSTGMRNCLGMQLAYAELYIGIVSFVWRFDLDLFETDVTDIRAVRDRFVPRPKLGSKGVRVTNLRRRVD